MPRWTRALIEVYTADGYQGCWEGTPNPARGGWDADDLPRLAQRIREDMRYPSARLQYCEDGDALIIGVFDGVEPPKKPKRGRVIIPDVFDDHL